MWPAVAAERIVPAADRGPFVGSCWLGPTWPNSVRRWCPSNHVETKAPLFCVHPAGGTVFCYRELAAALGDEQPLYGLQAQGLDGRHAPHTRLEDMAAHYIGAMREVQPHGPYHLGGWSLGGNIAYEMACQLHEQGDEVGLLTLMDAGAIAPDQKATEEDFLAMLLGLFPADAQLPLDDLRKLSPAQQLEYFVGRRNRPSLWPWKEIWPTAPSTCSMCFKPTYKPLSNIGHDPSQAGSRC